MRFSVEDRAVVRALKYYRGNAKRHLFRLKPDMFVSILGGFCNIGSCTVESFERGSLSGHRAGV